MQHAKQDNKYPKISVFGNNYKFDCLYCLSYGLPINILHYWLE